MGTWVSQATDLLWPYAIGAIPLALLVGAVTRWLPCRPATRHGLWLVVLLWLVAAPLLPRSPELPVYSMRVVSRGLQAETKEGPTGSIQSTIRNPQSAIDAVPSSSRNPMARSFYTPGGSAEPERVALSRRQGSRAPKTLAQATGPGGPLGLLSEKADKRSRSGVTKASRAVRTPLIADALPVSPGSYSPIPSPQLPGSARAPDRVGTGSARGSGGGEVRPLWGDEPRGVHDNRTALPAKTPLVADANEVLVQPNDSARAESPTTDQVGPWRRWIAGAMAVGDAIRRLPPIPTSLWVCGAVVLAICGAARIVWFRQRIASASPAPSSVRQMVSQESKAFGLRRVPETLMVESHVSPMIWCGRRLRLLLPARLWCQLDDTGRRAVLLHELAHVRRRDHWVSWAEMIVGILYWWHPLVWWVRRRLRAEAELCCDAWVTSLLPRSRRAYAEALLQTQRYIREETRWMPAVGIGISRGRAGRFARRLTMVMTRNVKPRLSASGIALLLVVAVTAWLATPAWSCPRKEKRAKAAATSASAPRAAPCEHCQAGKTCKQCKERKQCKAGKTCKQCKAGKTCEKCKSAKPRKSDKPCDKHPGAFGKALSTFEEHMARRGAEGRRSGVGLELLPKEVAIATGLGGLGLVVGGPPGGDLEDRLEELERELERLADELAKITESVAPGPAKREAKVRERRRERTRSRVREPRAPRAPREPGSPCKPCKPCAPCKPCKPCAPCKPCPPAPPRAPLPPFDIGSWLEKADDGERLIRAYRLPDGKREALTELMVRDDVPVLVRPLPDGIEVHGTARQQRIFHAFVKMIHPSGDGRSEAWPEVEKFIVRPRQELIQRLVERSIEPDTGRAHSAALAASVQQIREAIREHIERAGILEAQQKNMEAETQRLEIEAEVLRHQADAVRDSADDIREKADEVRERAEELREKAEKLREKAESAGEEAAADALVDDAQNLEQDAHRIDKEANRMEREANRVEKEAELIEKKANLVEKRAEQVEQQAEQLEEQAETAEEQAEELEEEIEALEEEMEEEQEEEHEHDDDM
ncbi:MAG: hypothetical protein JSU86_03895 [Phycisphaerales bacterium]|nr:MAG: hypothetical protein JSU86_03895 [Phycisphaerales bacterium]